MKLQKGTAVFKDVKITAEEAGEYVLRVASGSRKVRSVGWCMRCFAYFSYLLGYMVPTHDSVSDNSQRSCREFHNIRGAAVVPN